MVANPLLGWEHPSDSAMRKTLLVTLLGLALLPPCAATAADPDETYSGIPDYAYQPYVDDSDLPEVPRKTTFRLHGPDTLTARTWYVAWNGRVRTMLVSYPRVPSRRRLPLLLVFHGAGNRAVCDRTFGNTPGEFRFIIACLDGQGVKSRGYTYGSPQSLADYLQVPALLRRRLPGLRIDPARIIASGGSMGGQEALLFGAANPQLVSMIVAMDAPTDLGKRFWHLPEIRQRALFAECDGTPYLSPACYAARSPQTASIAALAASTQKIILYWSTTDELSRADQMPAFARALHAANPNRAIVIRIGGWAHGRAWTPATGNTEWLSDAGLAPDATRAETRFAAGWRLVANGATWTDDLPAFIG